jgi:uncharacterized membrane protein
VALLLLETRQRVNNVIFLHPELFLLALLIVPVVLLTSRRLLGLARWRRRSAVLLQTLSALLLIAAVAEPALTRPDNDLNLVVVLDASASVSAAGKVQAAAYAKGVLSGAGPTDHVSFIAAGQQATLLTHDDVTNDRWSQNGGENPKSKIQNPKSNSDTQQTALSTNLASGLRLAGSLLKDAGRRRVVVVSDGWETQGDAASEAARIAARGINIQAVALSALGNPEVILRGIDTPAYARVGDSIASNVRIYSTTATSATLSLSVDGAQPTSLQVDLKPGDNSFPLDQKVVSQGFHKIDVSIQATGDTSAENNAAASTLVVKSQPRVLVLEDRAGEAAAIIAALTESQVSVEVRTPSTIPSRVADLDGFDAVVMNNVAATSFTLDQQRTLQEYVRRNGKGLVVVGGPTSYAKGGYPDSVFEDMLPVSSQPGPRPEKGQTALILVLDRSNSMDEWMGLSLEATKFSMAKAAARLAVDSLRDGDTLGILTFDTEDMWSVPVQPVNGSFDKEAIKTLIDNIPLGGGTHIWPAVKDAVDAIEKVSAPNKHIVLMTDGQDFHQEPYDPLITRLRAAGATLSSIGVGADADKTLLTRLAKQGQGRYYFTERIDNIPKIVFKELDLALKEAVLEGSIQPQIDAPSPVLRGFAPQDFPQLSGYDLTIAKDDSVVALLSDQGRPLLAHWNYGLGRVVAFTSQAGPKWGSRWATWGDFSKFWSQAVRWTMSSPVNRAMQPSVTVSEDAGSPGGSTAHISVESLNPDNSFADLAEVTAALRSPSGTITSTVMSQTAPGLYEADVPLSEGGSYEVRLSREGQVTAISEAIGFSVPTGAEWMHAGTNDRLLRNLAGGRDYVTTPAQALDHTTLQGSSPEFEPLWAYLLAPALVALLLSVALRRLDFRPRRK